MMKAALEACPKLGLRSCCHHAQLAVGRMNSLKTAGWGLTSTEHSYGIPETLLETQTLQAFPSGLRLWRRIPQVLGGRADVLAGGASRAPRKWGDGAATPSLQAGHSFVPTFNVYDANRDLMRTRRADWHERFTDPTLWSYFQPQRGGHGAYWYRWSTTNEVEWRETFRLWMRFVNDYKNLGGRVCVGSDSGFMFQTTASAIVRELELLQEAGFTPSRCCARRPSRVRSCSGIDEEVGTLEVGKRARHPRPSREPADRLQACSTGPARCGSTRRRPRSTGSEALDRRQGGRRATTRPTSLRCGSDGRVPA